MSKNEVSYHWDSKMLISVFEFQEAGLDMLDSAKEPFIEINQILEALKQKDLQPALM